MTLIMIDGMIMGTSTCTLNQLLAETIKQEPFLELKYDFSQNNEDDYWHFQRDY